MAFFRKGPDGHTSKRKRTIDFEVDSETLEHEIDEWVASNRPKLGEVLLDLGSIDPEDLLDALQHQKDNPDEASTRLGQILLKLGKIDEKHLAAALAHQFGIPFVDLSEETADAEAANIVGEDLARKHAVVPLRVDDDGRVYLAVADPLDTAAIEELTQRCKRIGIVMGARSQIERLLDEAYNVLRTASEHIRAFELSTTEIETKSDDDSFTVDENAPVVQVANRILTQAVRSRASDVHIEPGEHAIRVRYRIDGAMSEAITLPANMAAALVSRFKVMAGLNIVERRRPQDGQFGVGVDGRPIDVRISTVATIHGEKVVMRLLDKTKSLISLKDLGMHPKVEEEYLKIVTAPLGMLLCTGPTGSGKTTTLYATLAEINDPTRNVVTIEDPVEYQFDGITQMPVSDTGTSFADGLRGILRQDPDVILVGEIRDEETARIAMQASLTGHFVLSSLHAVDSVAAVHRFTDMGLEPFLVASSLTGVVGQRLLRKICSNCKTEYTPTPREVTIVDEHVGHQPEVWVKGAGCKMCSDTGFRGRVGVYELLNVSDAIREMIVDRASHHELRALAIDEGMRTMQEQAFELVVNGITTVDDVLRSVYAPGATESQEAQLELPVGKRALRKARESLRESQERGATAEGETHEVASTGQPIPMGDGTGTSEDEGEKPTAPVKNGASRPKPKVARPTSTSEQTKPKPDRPAPTRPGPSAAHDGSSGKGEGAVDPSEQAAGEDAPSGVGAGAKVRS